MKSVLRFLIITFLPATLISCGNSSDTIKSYSFIGPKRNSESFFAVQQMKSGSVTRKTLVEIDSLNQIKFFPNALNDYSYGWATPLNDSLMLISKERDSTIASIFLYNIYTLHKLLILQNYRLISTSNNGCYFLTRNDDSDFYSLQLFQLHEEGCKFISAIPNVQVHDIFPFRQTDFIVRPKNRFGDTNQALFMIIDSLGEIKDSIPSNRAGNLRELNIFGFEGENPNQIVTPVSMPFQKGDSMSHTYLYIYDHYSKDLRPLITDMEITLYGFPVKNTSWLIFKGATIKEYWEEEREMAKAFAKAVREHPDVFIHPSNHHEGNWRMRDLKTGATRTFDRRMKYFQPSSSGRHIAVSFDDGHTEVIRTKTLWEEANDN